MVNYTNQRKDKVLLRMWMYPKEVEYLLESVEGEQINQMLNQIKDRGDIV